MRLDMLAKRVDLTAVVVVDGRGPRHRVRDPTVLVIIERSSRGSFRFFMDRTKPENECLTPQTDGLNVDVRIKAKAVWGLAQLKCLRRNGRKWRATSASALRQSLVNLLIQ
jgi:hypothetical protein